MKHLISTMKTIIAWFAIPLATVTFLLPLKALASDDPPQTCTSFSNTTTSVAATDGHTTAYDVIAQGFDPNPLMYTTINTRAGCLVVHLSVHAGHTSILPNQGFGDVYAVYEVTVDNVPMLGHTTGCFNVPTQQFLNCVLFNNDRDNGATSKQDQALVAGHSYHFYREVAAGSHRVQVKWAGCCNGYYNGINNTSYSTGAYGGGHMTLYYLR